MKVLLSIEYILCDYKLCHVKLCHVKLCHCKLHINYIHFFTDRRTNYLSIYRPIYLPTYPPTFDLSRLSVELLHTMLLYDDALLVPISSHHFVVVPPVSSEQWKEGQDKDKDKNKGNNEEGVEEWEGEGKDDMMTSNKQQSI